jgi:hypothetical protein
MCRCGLRCDYIYEALEYTGRDKKLFQLSVGRLFPDDDVDESKITGETLIPP